MILTITIPGVPLRKNRRHVLVGGSRPRMINSSKFKGFAGELRAAWDAAEFPEIRSGLWSMELHCEWPRIRHLDHKVALGDVDAPISSVLDAAQLCGILDDDARVLSVTSSKGYNKLEPCTRITFIPISRPEGS